MLAFDIDAEQDNVEQLSQNKWNFSKRLEETAIKKFQLATYTKGFFHSDVSNHEDYQYLSNSVDIQLGQKTIQQPRRKRAVRARMTLQTLKQPQNKQFENFINQQTRKEPQSSSFIVGELFSERTSYETRRKSQKRGNKAQKRNTTQITEQKKSRVQIPKIQSLIFQNQQEDQITPKFDFSKRQNAQKQQKLKNCSEIHTSQQQVVAQIEQKSYYQPPNQYIIKQVSSDYFTKTSISLFQKQLLQQTKRDILLRLLLIRDKDGLNAIWPQFHLYFQQGNQYVMSAKRTSWKPTSTFILSASKTNFQENSQYYLGKMKSNILGDVINVFGPGLNPSNAKENFRMPRELIATIVYKNSILNNGGPRQFKVFVKKQQYKYYSNFPQVIMYRDEIPLNLLYEFPQNKQKIKVYNNRKPAWVEKQGGYRLNFKGRALRASSKNFILEEKIIGPDVAVFGKVNQSNFNLDVYHPISPLVAFAVSLSSFDTRMMCQ